MLPEHFHAPDSTSVKPTPNPQPASTFNSPSQIWTNVTIPAGQRLRFKVEARRDACQAEATTDTFEAVAVTTTCLSRADPSTIKIKSTRKTAAPCPPASAFALFAAKSGRQS